MNRTRSDSPDRSAARLILRRDKAFEGRIAVEAGELRPVVEPCAVFGAFVVRDLQQANRFIPVTELCDDERVPSRRGSEGVWQRLKLDLRWGVAVFLARRD